MKKLMLVAVTMLLLVACSVPAKSGTFTGTYNSEDYPEATNKSKMTVELSLEEGKITDCKLSAYDQFGNLKDENYGKDAGDANYKLAQKAVAGMNKYPELLIESQDVDAIDAISGATISLQEFKIAVKAALAGE